MYVTISGSGATRLARAPRRLAALAGAVLPAPIRARLRECLAPNSTPPVGEVRFGSLRRLTPISREFGYDRGLPTDRYYIERFLQQQAYQVRGRVLEVADNKYTVRFGGDQVTQSDVMDLSSRPNVTLVGNLATGEGIPDAAFDCIILTQVLHLIYDLPAAVLTVHRALRPGGVLLATLPGISQICRDSHGRWSDCWRFTTGSARPLFEQVFGAASVEVHAHGNVLAAIAFLQGIAAEELHRQELEYHDPDYEMLITVKAVRPEHPR